MCQVINMLIVLVPGVSMILSITLKYMTRNSSVNDSIVERSVLSTSTGSRGRSVRLQGSKSGRICLSVTKRSMTRLGSVKRGLSRNIVIGGRLGLFR